MRGWFRFYRTSLGLGARYLVRNGYLREAVIRIVCPLDPSRYLELPWAMDALAAQPGERVLDLASPKLLPVVLARRGIEVVSVDAFDDEVERWRKLTMNQPNLQLEVADGRALPFEDASFDRASSVSVLEHIPEPGDEQALRELARIIRPGGRIVLTLPYSIRFFDEYREDSLYGGDSANGPTFFQRWYDDDRLERLLAAAPELRLEQRDTVRLQPNWNTAFTRFFPWLLPFGPFFGLLARERPDGTGADVVRLVLER